MQPPRGLVPSRVVGSSHLFSYGRGGGLRAETSSTMFSTKNNMQGKDKDKGNGRGKGKVFGK